MDFIVGLPNSHGYTAIMVVVDRLSKYAHFGPLPTGFDAPKVARLFVSTVVKLHGFPDKLLTDRDPIFVSDFWKELLTMSGTKLQFTTAYHPQTDGQSEVTNRTLEQYLRAFTFEQPKKWYDYLPWAELAMNCSVNISIGMSPFKALYGRDPPNLFASPALPAKNAAVVESLGERTALLRTLKSNLLAAQRKMAEYANKHRKHVEFNVGDDVLLRLQPYRQVSVGKPLSAKLARRYYGPFKIIERIGAVAYRLQLPLESRIHDVFHVSLLKPFIPPLTDSVRSQLPQSFNNHRPVDVPVRTTDEHVVLVHGLPQHQWLVHWSENADMPSWESKDDLLRHFPSLSLEDKAVPMEGGVDRGLNDVIIQDEGKTLHGQPEPPATANVEVATQLKKHAAKTKEVQQPKKDRPKRNAPKPPRYRDFK